MQKNKFFIVCAVLVTAGIILTAAGILYGGIVNGIKLDFGGLKVYAPLLAEQSGGNYYEKEKKLEAFDSIELESEYADVRVEVSDSNEYEILYGYQKESDFMYKISDGQLKIRQGYGNGVGVLGLGNAVWFFAGYGSAGQQNENESAYITIRIPEDAALSSVKLNTDSGSIACENMQGDIFQIRADYGDIMLQKIRTQSFQADTESGLIKVKELRGDSCVIRADYSDIKLDEIKLTGDMDIKTESGNVSFQNIYSRDIKLDCAYGDADGQQIVFQNAQVSMESGNCRLSDITFDDLKVDAAYGNVVLEPSGPAADYGYKLGTEYGDITIDGEKMGESFVTLEKEGKDKKIEIECEVGNIEIYP